MADQAVKSTPHLAVVAGDVTIDWNLARTRELGSDGSVWSAGDSARTYKQLGGAALLAELATAVARSLAGDGAAHFDVRSPDLPEGDILPGDQRLNHSYAIWSQFPYGRSAKDRSKPRVWFNRARPYRLSVCPVRTSTR